MRAQRLSPRTYRRITLLALVGVAFIIVTGGAVRLTGSGLGCPDWPTCDQGRVIAPLQYHAMVEFVNRTVTGLVSVAVILAVLGSLIRRPRRPDLLWLSLGLVGGVVGQVVLGGLTVLFDLAPPFVMSHFLLSMAILWCGIVLHHRAGLPDQERPGRPGRADAAPTSLVVDADVARMRLFLLAAAGLVVFLGTVVTAAGPHGGDENVPRLDVSLHDVARIHGGSVILFLAIALLNVALLVRTGAPVLVLRRAEVLLAAIVAQGVVGYVQYFTGVPALLVGVHIAGAVAVWVATIEFGLALAQPVPAVPAHARLSAGDALARA